MADTINQVVVAGMGLAGLVSVVVTAAGKTVVRVVHSTVCVHDGLARR